MVSMEVVRSGWCMKYFENTDIRNSDILKGEEAMMTPEFLYSTTVKMKLPSAATGKAVS